MEDVIQRFNRIEWHDSKFVGLSFYNTGSDQEVKASLKLLREDNSYSPAEITFHECAYIEADVYLEATRRFSDDIIDAACYASSQWKTSVSEPGPYDPILGGRGLEDYLHFEIYLCVPGGIINILAKDFSLEAGTGGRVPPGTTRQ